METKNIVAYTGDEICDIKEIYEWGDSSENLEILGINYTSNRKLVMLFKAYRGKGLNFILKDEKIIMNFCVDMGVYDFSEDFKTKDFQKLKGKEVKVFIRNLKNNSKKGPKIDYISAVSPIHRNLRVESKEHQKTSWDLKDYGNNPEDWRLEDCVSQTFRDNSSGWELENRFGNYSNEIDYWKFN